MNKFKNYIWMAAGFAILAAVISGIAAAPAIAQAVKAALVKNVDEPGRQPFEVNVDFTSSGCSSHCVNFISSGTARNFATDPPVPMGKRWVVTEISGSIPSSSSIGNYMLLQDQQCFCFTVSKFYYWGPFISVAGVLQGFNAPVFTTIGPGERAHLYLEISAANNNFGDIVLSGYLIDSTN